MMRVNTRLQQVREYPIDASEPVIEASDVSDRPIARFALTARPPTKERIRKFQVEHPELGPVIGNHWELLSVELKSLYGDPRWHAHLQKLGIAPEQLAAFEFEIPLPE